MKRCCGDYGFSTVYAVLITPLVVVMMLGVVIYAGRVGAAQGNLTSVSRDVARAASRARSWPDAQAAAAQTLSADLDANQTCRDAGVTLHDPDSFAPGGWVTADVWCVVHTSDLGLPGIPGTRTITASSTEVIDTYREIP